MTKPLTPKMADALAKIRANGGRVGYGLQAFKGLNINGSSVNALRARGALVIRTDDNGTTWLEIPHDFQSLYNMGEGREFRRCKACGAELEGWDI